MPWQELPPEAIWERDAVRTPYKSDLTDAQWDFVRPILPPIRAKNGFPPTDLREVFNTILYQTRTGVPWEYLPAEPDGTFFGSPSVAQFSPNAATNSDLPGEQ